MAAGRRRDCRNGRTRSRPPRRRYAGDAALARARGRVFLFEIFDGHFRGPAHAFVDSVTGLFIAECPEDADAFRLSCGQVESGDRSFAVVSLDQFHVAEVLAVGRVASFVDELAHGFAGCRGADLAADELGSFADPIAWRVACCRIVCRWVGRVQRVVAIDRLPRVTERVFGVLSLVRFIDMVCSLVSGGYRPRVSEMPEQRSASPCEPYWSIARMRFAMYPFAVACPMSSGL